MNWNWMWLGGFGWPAPIGYIVSILIFLGWILNIVALATGGGSIAAMTVLLLLRILGIFIPPLGAVLGWLWVFKIV